MKERGYKGQHYRPKPEVYLDKNMDLSMILTPWGSKGHVKGIYENIKDYFLSTKDDYEATTPYGRLTCLSPIENNLRTAILLTNEKLYKEKNNEEYTMACEIFAGSLYKGVFYWGQVGYPSFYLLRDHKLTPLSIAFDNSLNFSTPSHTLPPMPKKVIGLNPSVDFEVKSFKVHPGDQLIWITHAHSPGLIETHLQGDVLDQIITHIAQSNPNHSFWAGQLEI